MRAAPLAGVRVLEVGVFMAAPFATMQLADLGAEVVKVENPEGGEPVRSTGPFVAGHSSPYLRLNRSKRSVALDLKSDEGREAFLRLAAGCDVVVENLGPGRCAGSGSATTRSAVNPGVVYASASGFGQDGPLADRPGLDIMAQARGGLMSITGTPDGAPVKVGVPLCDLVCGIYTALAVTAALRERDRSGEGQYVDVSLLESAVSLAVWEAGRYFATGEVGGPLGSAHQSQAPYQAFRTADGWATLGAITPRTWAGLCEVLGLEELRDDERFATSRRHARREELAVVVEERTSALTTAELVARLEAVDVPCAPIADYGQVFTDEHLAARDFFWDAPHPVAGAVRQIGSPMRFSAPRSNAPVPARCWVPTPAPRCGRPATVTTRSTPWWRRGRRRRLDDRKRDPMTGDVAIALEDAVLTVTFDRPEQHNALTFAMYDALHDACERADAEPEVRVLVVRGAGGRAFAAGTDISAFREFTDGADGVAYEERITRVVNRLEEVTVPTVAAVDGYCLGGGLALAAVCDLRVATRSSRFGVPIARTLGNCLSMNSVSVVVARLGVADPRPAAAGQAAGRRPGPAAGFVSELCDDGDLDAAVQDVVDTLLAHAPLTMWASKVAVARLRRQSLPDGDDLVSAAFGSDDFRRAVATFGSGEPSRWDGA